MRANLLALAFGCALVLVLAEGVVRVVPPTNRFVTFADASVDVTRPSASFVFKGRNVGHISAFRLRHRTNALGFADHDYPFEKPDGTVRVVVLGDSQVEALQVPLAARYPKRVEARLRAEGHAVDVVALGRSGYGAREALETYRDVGRRFAPDHVVWGFTDENDVVEASRPLRAAIYRDQATRLLRPPEVLRGSILASLFYSRRWRPSPGPGDLLPSRYATLADIGSPLLVLYLEQPPPLYRAAEEAFERDLTALVREVLADGPGLTVVSTAGAYPDFLAEAYPGFTWRPRRLDALARRIVEGAGARFVTAKPRFGELERAGGPPIRFPGDGHLTERGHEVVAELLHAELTANVLRPRQPRGGSR